jgi:hypothetical protein
MAMLLNINLKYHTWLKVVVSDEHSSLVCRCDEKRFITLCPLLAKTLFNLISAEAIVTITAKGPLL